MARALTDGCKSRRDGGLQALEGGLHIGGLTLLDSYSHYRAGRNQKSERDNRCGSEDSGETHAGDFGE